MQKSVIKSVGAFSPAALTNKEVIKFVNTLPQAGEEGFLYCVPMPELDRDAYSIVQLFVWSVTDNEWKGAGAFSIDIDPDEIVYKDAIPYATATKVGGIKQSFDAATGTWTVTTEELV